MIVLVSIFLVCSIVFFILAHVRVCAIKRKFRVNLAAFDLLNTRYVAKCKAYDELVNCFDMVAIHKKTGNKYTVLYDGALDCTNSRDGTVVVVYTRDDKVFVREKQEFMEKFSVEPLED